MKGATIWSPCPGMVGEAALKPIKVLVVLIHADPHPKLSDWTVTLALLCELCVLPALLLALQLLGGTLLGVLYWVFSLVIPVGWDWGPQPVRLCLSSLACLGRRQARWVMLGNSQFPEQAFWLARAGTYHHFFLWSSSIPLCACTSLFICSLFEGLAGCFQFAVIMNGATKEMDVWFLCGCKFPTSFVMPDCWIVWQNCGQLCKKLSNYLVKYCAIFISHQSFHVLSSHWSCQVCFYLCPSNRCVVVSQCCFSL